MRDGLGPFSLSYEMLTRFFLPFIYARKYKKRDYVWKVRVHVKLTSLKFYFYAQPPASFLYACKMNATLEIHFK